MCILKISSDSHSFATYAAKTGMTVVSVKEKGEIRRKTTGEKHLAYRISLDVSGREWDDFPGQVQDAIDFLSKWESDVSELMSSHAVSSAYLDFPIYSRLDGNIVNQNDHIPRELVVLAGRMQLGIEIAIYARDAFEGVANEA